MRFLIVLFSLMVSGLALGVVTSATPGINGCGFCAQTLPDDGSLGNPTTNLFCSSTYAAGTPYKYWIQATAGQGLTGTIVYRIYLSGSKIGVFNVSADSLDGPTAVWQTKYNQGANEVVAGTDGYLYDIHLTAADDTGFNFTEKFSGRAPSSANFKSAAITNNLGLSGAGRCKNDFFRDSGQSGANMYQNIRDNCNADMCYKVN